MQNYWSPLDPRKKINSHFKNTNIQRILSEVNMKILNFLQELHIIYSSNNIHFDIVYLQDAMIRLLTPFELAKQIETGPSNTFANFGVKSNFAQKEYPIRVESIQDKYKTTLDELKLIPAPYSQKQPGPNKNKTGVKPNKKNINPPPKRDRGRPVLNQQMQCELVDWALNKLRQNRRVRRKDLARRALKMSGNKEGFAGSIGWVNRFLVRHKRLAVQLKKVARNNIGIRHGYLSDSSINQMQLDKLQENEQNGQQVKNQQKETPLKQENSQFNSSDDEKQQYDSSMSSDLKYVTKIPFQSQNQKQIKSETSKQRPNSVAMYYDKVKNGSNRQK